MRDCLSCIWLIKGEGDKVGECKKGEQVFVNKSAVLSRPEDVETVCVLHSQTREGFLREIGEVGF
ncbi:MAG TPA: hypothetical protein VK175_06270 [Leadbetterella sp.]|nr:hypothetical protein [Leadbetterella sp.]